MPTDSSNLRIGLLAMLVAFLSATAGVALWKMTQMRQPPAQATLIVLPEPRPINPFLLEDQNGQDFTLDRLRGSWSLMFFGFTHCPDVCPTALYELQQVREQLRQKISGDTSLPNVVFVSVDPERDSPEKLQKYISHFDPDFTGVSGPHKQLGPFTRQVGIAYHIEDHEAGSQAYAVDHSSGILLIDPQARLYGVFPAPHRSEAMAGDLLNVLEHTN